MSFVIAGIIGAIVGTLINYLADTLPEHHWLAQPVCKNCGHKYAVKDYLSLGKCRECGTRRSPRSLFVLAAAIILCVLLVLFTLRELSFLASLPLLLFLGVITVIDIEHRIVLLETSLFGLILCFIYGIFLWGITEALLGGLIGLLVMLFFYFLGIAFSKLVGKLRHQAISEVAFGFGDVFAGTFLGLLMGRPLVLAGIVIGILSFAAFSLIYFMFLIISKRYRAFTNALPFTPFLILGAIAAFYLLSIF